MSSPHIELVSALHFLFRIDAKAHANYKEKWPPCSDGHSYSNHLLFKDYPK